MEILSSTPDRIHVEVRFEKPFRSTSQSVFDLSGDRRTTEVVWTMRGGNKGLAALFMKVFEMDKAIGKDFEKGLARLKAAAEAPA